MISVVIPAHNEAAVIVDSLRALTEGASPGELEVIVVCNGCTDETADRARAFGGPVTVIETDVASKANALNLGDAAASGFPRLYADADVTLSLEGVRAVAAALEAENVFAAAPAVETRFLPGTSWTVRAYYRAWMALPYVREGMMAAGVYAVSDRGRGRFASFPEVIADDGFFRLQFSNHERVEVKTAVCVVKAPRALADLVRIKTRSRLGFFQLRQRYPDLFLRETKSKRYSHAVLFIFRNPSLWPSLVPYLWVNGVSRFRAKRQLRRLDRYVWERDDSSRIPAREPARTAG